MRKQRMTQHDNAVNGGGLIEENHCTTTTAQKVIRCRPAFDLKDGENQDPWRACIRILNQPAEALNLKRLASWLWACQVFLFASALQARCAAKAPHPPPSAHPSQLWGPTLDGKQHVQRRGGSACHLPLRRRQRRALLPHARLSSPRRSRQHSPGVQHHLRPRIDLCQPSDVMAIAFRLWHHHCQHLSAGVAFAK